MALKNKISQNDLRRIMSEQKMKLLEKVKKIESPLAKYKDNGQLICILCDHIVRNEQVWNVHITSKKHKENISKKKSDKFVTPHQESITIMKPPLKRTIEADSDVAPKKLKSILKNGPKPELPDGFFDSKDKMDTEVKTDLETTTEALHNAQIKETPDVQQEGDLVEQSELLPEGFFDDPVLDAKARNVEYRDPIQEEWERFQKEIKEESTVSTQIIQDDQEEATAERQIQEIDEQMRNWSRVLDLEVKKEKVQSVVTKNTNEDMDQESSEEGDDFDEFLDWRSKKSFK